MLTKNTLSIPCLTSPILVILNNEVLNIFYILTVKKHWRAKYITGSKKKHKYFFITGAARGDTDFYNKINILYTYNQYVFLKKINSYIQFYYVPYWARITFRGKGYRIKRFQPYIYRLFFGHSHRTYIRFFKKYFNVYRKRRTILNVWCRRRILFYRFLKIVEHIRIMNRYTKRGLRIKKQNIRKRFGKISQYVSRLHDW